MLLLQEGLGAMLQFCNVPWWQSNIALPSFCSCHVSLSHVTSLVCPLVLGNANVAAAGVVRFLTEEGLQRQEMNYTAESSADVVFW